MNKRIEENIDWLFEVNPEYKEIKTCSPDIVGLYLIKRNEIVSCIDVDTLEENLNLLKLDRGYTYIDNSLNGLKINIK